MKRWSWLGGALALCLIGAAPAMADYHVHHYGPYHSSDQFRLRMGLFTPRGDSEYWQDAESQFNTHASDLEDVVFGGDWIHEFSPYVGAMVSGDWYSGESTMSYRNFTDSHGHEIRHTTSFDQAPFTAGVIFQFTPEAVPVHPYASIGGGMYAWHLDEHGDFIDFENRNQIFHDTFHDDGVTFGYYGLAGIDVMLTHYFSVFGEARWDYAKQDLNGDFAGLGKIDLGGRRITGGVSWHF
jgi:hypothetical protein